MLPHLHEILALCTSCFEKMNTEAARLGIIKRKLLIPESTVFMSATDMANLINVQFIVCAKLFKMVLGFAKRYLNDSYSITLFVNMNRLRGAEIELNEMLKSSRELVTMLNTIRLKNLCMTIVVKAAWLKKARKKVLLLKQSKKE